MLSHLSIKFDSIYTDRSCVLLRLSPEAVESSCIRLQTNCYGDKSLKSSKLITLIRCFLSLMFRYHTQKMVDNNVAVSRVEELTRVAEGELWSHVCPVGLGADN